MSLKCSHEGSIFYFLSCYILISMIHNIIDGLNIKLYPVDSDKSKKEL